MEQQLLFLNDYEILVFDKVLQKVIQSLGGTKTEEHTAITIFLSNGIKVPVDKKITAKFSDGTEVCFHLTESSSKEYNFHSKKYRMSISPIHNVNGHLSKIINEFNNVLSNTPPDSFISLEHFKYYLQEPTEMKIGSFPENFLTAAERAIKAIFKDWEEMDKVTSCQQNLIPRRLRIEIKENEFRYIELNQFTVYRKDNVFVAAGISYETDLLQQKQRYFCTIFCKNSESHIFEKLFNKNFEDLIISDKELKGGKFTGDFKILKLQNKLSMDDIVLEDSVREKIQREIFNFFNLKELYKKAGLPFKRGVALYGPTGTGKTMIAKIIASQMKETVIWVKAGDLVCVDDINRIFRLARLGAPSVVVLEDIDFYAADRNSQSPDKIGVATLMANLDGLEENEGILVIVTTNRIDVIEKAIIERPGRIDTKIFLGELGKDCIARLLEKKLGNFERDFGNFLDVIPQHMVMSGSAVIELSSAILREALKRTSDAQIVITKHDVEKALKEHFRRENKMTAGFKSVSSEM